MVRDAETAYKTAEFLLQIKAIKLNPGDPFHWSSGWRSPIYCDNRKALSYPIIRTFLRERIAAAVEEAYTRPDAIAAVATGAIALGALVAEQMNLPLVYVRPEPKKHGMKNQVEGHLEPGQKVVVFEDLVSTGGSSLKAVEALREEGAEVLGMMALFTYGFAEAAHRFEEAECRLVTLSDYAHLIVQAAKTGAIDEQDAELLSKWRESPESWGQPKSVL
ncbi:MAG: orotate phosphoribosyltransferase [Flavobacteriia bacterium]|nr:orotate phosphoribosyltransferase [Flavobacteriia bacterium]